MTGLSSADAWKPPAGIKALPPITVRRIGSSQVLVDPSSVVKELIDNALDARATAVFVDIAANAIDFIQVKDNGHGIPAEDRALVCRRYRTSKIRDFHDLKEVGGKWLGFRGEALASMVELSGSLEVGTRVEGEPVAVLLRFGRNGEVESTERASHPVGTTIKVTDFFNTFPVRQQDALKHSAKFLAKIRRMMQAYSLARPTVRFQLKVLKAKNEKGNFTYAPKTGANVEDAAFKAIGRTCASQCDWSSMESDGFEVHAFLPKPDAVGAKVANEGSFISVDSRPVTSGRGTPKKIVAVFKEKLRKANPALANVKDPFLCMNIICPSDSYDPNIEPAKDDVLFEDPDIVISVVERLLMTFYSEAISRTPDLEADAPPSAQVPRASSPLPSDIHYEEDRTSVEQILPSPQNEGRQWRTNMYGIDEEDLRLLPEHQPPVIEEEGSRAVAVSNPWTVAKMNTTTKPKKSAGNPQLMTPAKGAGDVTMGSSSPMPTPPLQKSSKTLPLTPQTLSQSNASQCSLDGELAKTIQHVARPRSRKLNRRTSQHGEETPVIQARQQFSEPPEDICGLSTSSSMPRQHHLRPPTESILSDQFPFDSARGIPIHMIPEAPPASRRSQRKQQGFQKKSFKPPAPGSEHLWFGQPTRGRHSESSGPRSRRRPARNARNAPPLFPTEAGLNGLNGDVLDAAERLDTQFASENNTDIRDFFGCRTVPQYRHASAESGLGSASGSTPINRQGYAEDEAPPRRSVNAGARNQRPRSAPESEAGFPNQDVSTTRNATPGPSRPGRRSTTSHLRRTQSSKLSLERTPAGYHTQDIVLPLSFSVVQLTAFSRKLNMTANSLEWGYPAEEGYDIFAVPAMDGTVHGWARKTDEMLDRWFEREKDVGFVVGFMEESIRAKLEERGKEDEEMLPF